MPRLRRAFLAGSLALVAIALTFAGLSAANQAGRRWVRQSREISRIARTARSLANDREASLRGFLLSGNEIALAPEIAARPVLRQRLDSLAALTAKRFTQRERVRVINEAISGWERGYAEPTLARARRDGVESVSETALAGKALFDNVKSSFDAFQAAEDRSYARLIEMQDFLERVAFGAVMLEILLLLGVLLRLRRDVLGQATELIHQQDQLEEQAQELEAQTAELEEQTALLEEQTDEARSVSRALEATNQELAETVARLEKSHEEVRGVTREKQETMTLLDFVLESSPIGFAFHDRELRYTRINPALAVMARRPASEHIGRTPAEVHPDVASFVEPLLARVIATGEAIVNVPITRSVENGTVSEHHFLASFFPVKRANGEIDGVGVVVLETTERRQLEEQLLQSQKMEAVGRLAGGVAHDFNNILTAIKSYSDLLVEDMGAGRGRVEDVQEIRVAADRAATLTRQLLAFSRQQMLRPRVLDLNVTVRDLKNMLDRIIGADIELNTKLAPDLGMLTADPGQIEQILMNLVINARDAMPDGGRLDIETGNVELDGDYSRTHAATPPGPYIMLAVSDTGMGMSRETQQRIFEPFFTTKGKGQGTGLGLSTVYGIVKQSGGSIWVYSEPGRGTTFKIYLPRVSASVEVTPPVSTGNGSGKETILLVEDEDSVRAVASRVLRRSGYTVVEARNGIDALRACEERGTEVDLIITDIVMPEMGGFELASRVRRARPGARILFTSGYTEHAVLRRSFVDPGEAFLEKPFTPARLAQRAREVLDAPAQMSGPVTTDG